MEKQLVCGLSVLLGVVFTFPSCKDKKDCNPAAKNVVYELQEADTLSLPYSGRDSLWFEKHDTAGVVTDTVLFTGQGKIHDYFSYTTFDPECPQRFSHGMWSAWYVSAGQDSLYLTMLAEEGYADVRFHFLGKTYLTSTHTLQGDFGYTYPVITLNGRTYSNVIAACSVGKNEACDSNRMLVNRQEGLLQVIAANKSLFTLLRRK